jgi:hypothetical protein
MAISVLNHVIASSPDTNTFTSTSIDTGGANLLVLGISGYGPSGFGTVSDSKSNTWHQLTPQGSTSNNCNCAIYYATVEDGSFSVGTGHQFTYTGSLMFGNITLIAVSGAKTTSVFDQENGAVFDTSGPAEQPGSVTPSEDNELVVTVVSGNSFTSSVTIDGGFTISDQVNNGLGAHRAAAMAYLVQTTAAAANPTWTNVENSDTLVIATFKAGAGGGASFVPKVMVV